MLTRHRSPDPAPQSLIHDTLPASPSHHLRPLRLRLHPNPLQIVLIHPARTITILPHLLDPLVVVSALFVARAHIAATEMMPGGVVMWAVFLAELVVRGASEPAAEDLVPFGCGDGYFAPSAGARAPRRSGRGGGGGDSGRVARAKNGLGDGVDSCLGVGLGGDGSRRLGVNI